MKKLTTWVVLSALCFLVLPQLALSEPASFELDLAAVSVDMPDFVMDAHADTPANPAEQAAALDAQACALMPVPLLPAAERASLQVRGVLASVCGRRLVLHASLGNFVPGDSMPGRSVPDSPRAPVVQALYRPPAVPLLVGTSARVT